MRGLLTAACLLGSAWLLRPPSVAEAASNVQLQLNDSSTPVERAYTRGIVTLRAPTSTMLRIPALKYEMGSTAMDVVEALLLCNREPYGELCDQGMFVDELPQHSVSLDSYWLDRTEVTVADYARCVRLGRCNRGREGGAARFERPN